MSPDTRLAPSTPLLRRLPQAIEVVSHTVRKHSTWRHSPAATANMAFTTAPLWPGVSIVPQNQVGAMPRASATG